MKVYDIVNAGPNHRFTIRGADKQPILVSNCVSALAAKLLKDIIIEIEEPGVLDVWLSVHDEAPILLDDSPAAKAYAEKRIVEVFTKTPDCMPGLPMGVEYGFGYRYGESKS